MGDFFFLEVVRLLEVARRRPVRDLQLVRRGVSKGKDDAKIRPEVLRAAEILGVERALIYELFVTTGLRRGELESVTVGDVHLDEPTPHLVLRARHAKNRREARVPLRGDLVDDIRTWLRRSPKLSLDAPLVRVPKALAKILDRDLALVGIPKKDARGRTVGVHALRDTFGTLIARAGVPLRTAQDLMRHSDPRLSANLYQHLELAELRGALEKLPALGGSESPTKANADSSDGAS